MITEDYVSFETARLLKEKGFNEICYRSYVKDELAVSQGFNNYYYTMMYPDSSYRPVSAPTLQMAMKWLREVHHIIIVPQPLSFNAAKDYLCENWVYSLWVDYKLIIDESLRNQSSDYCPTYEKVCEAAILYCLKNLI